MAIRQYIGARYVPKFMGTYDPTQIYEALCVVDNGQGTSYISKTATPAGTPLTDTTHWAIYGASSGAIINLQNQINSLDTRIDSVEDVVSLTANKRVIVIADSYGTTGYNPQPFTFRLQNKLDLSNDDYFAYSEGSMGIVEVGSGGHTALTLLQTHENDITNHNTISDIVMTVGLNDYNHSQADITSAFNNLVSYLRTEYANAKIHWAFIGNSYTMALDAYMALYNNYKTLVNNSGVVHWAANTEYIMHNIKNMQNDGVHPNSDGSEVLASAIAEYIKTGSYHYSVRNTASIDFGTGTGTYTETIEDGIFSILFNGMYNSNSFQMPAANAPVVFGSLTDNAIRGKGVSSCTSSAFTTDTNYQNPLMLQMFVSGNDLLIKRLTGAAYTINGIQINAFNYTGLTIEA